MEKYTETEINSNESLIEYEYHIDDITLLGFKILSLPLKQSDWPTWFSNFIDKTGVFMSRDDGHNILISGMANTYNKQLIGNQLFIGDYILYDTRCEDVYATNHDGILNLLNTITGYTYELLLDAVIESDSNDSDTKVDNDSPSITTKKDNINPNHYKFGDMEAMPFIDAVTEFGEFQPVETPHVKDAIKYLIRYPRKNGLEDLKKAQWFINHLIEVREKIESSVDNSIVTFTNDSEVNYSGHGLAYVQALVKHGIIYTDISWTRKKIKTLSGDLFINAGDSLVYVDDEIYFYNQDGVYLVDNLVPKSREASLAQTKIEEAVMWANAGIARNITKED